MPDDNIKAVLKRAADDPQFLQALLADREAALKDVKLDEAERRLLLSAPSEHLHKVVEYQRQLEMSCSQGLGVASWNEPGDDGDAHERRGIEGHTVETFDEDAARYALLRIAVAQDDYHQAHGRYSSLDELRKHYLKWPNNNYEQELLARYRIEITLSGNSFTATARHRERPDTRKAFTVGPDGVVKELPRLRE